MYWPAISKFARVLFLPRPEKKLELTEVQAQNMSCRIEPNEYHYEVEKKNEQKHGEMKGLNLDLCGPAIMLILTKRGEDENEPNRVQEESSSVQERKDCSNEYKTKKSYVKK